MPPISWTILIVDDQSPRSIGWRHWGKIAIHWLQPCSFHLLWPHHCCSTVPHQTEERVPILQRKFTVLQKKKKTCVGMVPYMIPPISRPYSPIITKPQTLQSDFCSKTLILQEPWPRCARCAQRRIVSSSKSRSVCWISVQLGASAGVVARQREMIPRYCGF